ncbi:MAG: DUF1353 domain-containing protein [Xenococcaceae cyanobacterium]
MPLINDGKPLYLTRLPGKNFRLIDNWVYDSELYGRISVPKRYVSDLASIPSWAFWWTWGAWNIAAIPHDFLYQYGFIWQEKAGEYSILQLSKKETDILFYQINLELKVSPLTAFLMYQAVRFFGVGVWDK